MNKIKFLSIDSKFDSQYLLKWLLTILLIIPFFEMVPVADAQQKSILDNSAETVTEQETPKDIYLLSQSLQLGKKPARGAYFSSDNQQILILSGNGSLELYNAQSGKRQRVIPTLDHNGISLVPHPGGRLAVTGGEDDTVRVWNTHRTTSQGVFRGHLDEVTALALNVTGEILASGSKDGSLILWDMKTQEIINSTKIFPNGAIRHITFHPSGESVAIGGEKGILEIRSIPKMKVLVQLTGHSGDITGIQFTPRGNLLVSSSKDGKLIQWEWKTGNVQREIDLEQSISSFNIHPQFLEVVIGTIKGRLETWSLETGKRLHQINKSGTAIVHVRFDRNGYRLLSSMNDGNVQVWELGTSIHLKNLSGHTRPINSLDFSQNGKYLISSATDKSVRIWDVKSGQPARTYDMGSHRVLAVRFAPSSQRFATAGADSSVAIWGTQDGEKVHSLRSHKGKVNSVAYHPTEPFLLSGGSDRQWTLWDLNTGKAILAKQGHLDQILATAFSPDGKMFATSGSDKTVMLWSFPKGEALATLKGHRQAVTTISFSPNGKFLASGSQDNLIYLWRLAPEILKAPYRRLEGHGYIVNQVVFSKDNKALLSISKDKTMRLWEVQSGKMFRILHGDTTPLTSMALSPDGKNIALSNLSTNISILSYPENLHELKSLVEDSEVENTEVVKLDSSTPTMVIIDEEETEAPVVDLGDLGDAEYRMTAEELRAYAAPELNKTIDQKSELQGKLNKLLKKGNICNNFQMIEETSIKVLAKVPNDLAAYHALAKISLLRGDFNALNLLTMLAVQAEWNGNIYDYSTIIQVRNVFNSWKNDVFDQSFIRRGNQQKLKQVLCGNEPQTVQLDDIARKMKYSIEFIKKVNQIPRIIDLMDFVQIEEKEFANRMFQEIKRLHTSNMSHPLSRLSMLPTEISETTNYGNLILNLEKAETWKSEGVATFQLHRQKEPWQTYHTDQDNKVMMIAPEGKYSLKVAGKVIETFMLKANSTVELEIE